MPNFGKKILGAFVDLNDEKEEHVDLSDNTQTATQSVSSSAPVNLDPSEKFKNYFDKLFGEANMPGPDYFEFTKMIEAMSAIPDERTKYATAFAGLSIQGLDKKKLLETAASYLKILDNDAQHFTATVSKTLQEKVTAKKKEMEDKTKRIQDLTKEINELTARLQTINDEVRDNEEKINANAASYQSELQQLKSRISQDLQKINQYIP